MTHDTPALDRAEILRQTQSLRDLAVFLVRDAAAAEDVVQNAWLAEVEGRRPPDVPRAWWLRGVVRNLSARFARDGARRRRREIAVARPEEVRVTADAAAVRAESQQRLTAAVLALEEPYRSVVLLRFFEGLAPGEIAARTRESPGTVRTRLHRALEMLRARLDRDCAGDRRAWARSFVPLVLAPGPRAQPAGVSSALGGAAVKSSSAAWIAAALLLVAVGGTVTLMVGGAESPSGTGAEVASATSPSRTPRESRAPRARQPENAAHGKQPAAPPPAGDTNATVDARPAEPQGLARAVAGVVVDRANGRPLDGARVLLCHVTDDGAAPTWHGDTTAADGRFECAFDETDDLAQGRLEVRVRKAGYEDARLAAEKGDMTVRLQPRDHEPAPGRVVGLAVDPKGHPCPGRLLVESMDDFGAYQAQWTRADAAGSFVLEGLPAGHWRLRADLGDGPFVEVLVPERGEARVELRTELPVAEAEMGNVAALESAVGELDSVRKQFDEIAKSSPATVKRREEEAEKLRAGVESMRTRVARGRDVVVSGLPASADGAVVRLAPKAGRNWFWRSRADGASATFADVPAGSYVLRIETPAGLTDAGAIEVTTDGPGPLEVSLGAGK